MLSPQVIFEHYGPDGLPHWRVGAGFVRVIETRRTNEVCPCLQQVEQAVKGGLFAAGYIAYEAAAGLDPHLVTHDPTELPLAWFALFRELHEGSAPLMASPDPSLTDWQPLLEREPYRSAIRKIKDYIATGDTYQVNFTFPLQTQWTGDPFLFWRRVCGAQQAGYGAYLDTGRHVICSASPELFFRQEGEAIVSRPMKGTAARGLLLSDDLPQQAMLAQSSKNRAENAMIVDMTRNDLGRIAVPGSVRVSQAFTVEKYPTIYQMTSTVKARTQANFPQIMQALFPPASITGAPKVRTMQIIRELEPQPRGVYTGCIGFLTPQGETQFNVAIRTVTVDRETMTARYGVGGGIVWDSQADEEYAECQAKAAVLSADRPEFELLETLRWEKESGYFLLDRHLHRLADSAAYFDFSVNLQEITDSLRQSACEYSHPLVRVRLRVNRQGKIQLESAPLVVLPPDHPWRLRMAKEPIDSRNVFLYHKTTHRTVYEQALTRNRFESRPSIDPQTMVKGCEDVILWNERGEVTETTIANLVVEIGGRRYTPPVACGLLPGVFRAELLATGQLREKVLTRQDLLQAEAVYAINSVRKWMTVEIMKNNP